MKRTGIAKYIASLGKKDPNSPVTQVALLIRQEWTARIKKEKKIIYEDEDEDDNVIIKGKSSSNSQNTPNNNNNNNNPNEKEEENIQPEIDRRVEIDELPDREMIRVKIYPITGWHIVISNLNPSMYVSSDKAWYMITCPYQDLRPAPYYETYFQSSLSLFECLRLSERITREFILSFRKTSFPVICDAIWEHSTKGPIPISQQYILDHSDDIIDLLSDLERKKVYKNILFLLLIES